MFRVVLRSLVAFGHRNSLGKAFPSFSVRGPLFAGIFWPTSAMTRSLFGTISFPRVKLHFGFWIFENGWETNSNEALEVEPRNQPILGLAKKVSTPVLVGAWGCTWCSNAWRARLFRSTMLCCRGDFSSQLSGDSTRRVAASGLLGRHSVEVRRGNWGPSLGFFTSRIQIRRPFSQIQSF